MYKNILAPINLESSSKVELLEALKLAQKFNSKVFLLSVHEQFKSKEEMVMSRVSVNTISEEIKEAAIEAKNKLKQMVDDTEFGDVECDYILRDGKPENAIVDVALELNINLIVMSTDGKDSMSDYVSGTISQIVIDKSSCPVLVIPIGDINE